MRAKAFFKILTIAASFGVGAALTPVQAQEARSQAESWGLQNEELAVMSGKVVDVLCELSGDCPAKCGDGTRQLGLLTPQNKLVLVSKNGQPAFNGAVPDLLPYCQKLVEIDGLYAGSEKNKLFQVQLIREKGKPDWNKAEIWTKIWQEKNPTATGSPEEWFHQDPRIKKQIETSGYLGLGPEADKAFIKKNF